MPHRVTMKTEPPRSKITRSTKVLILVVIVVAASTGGYAYLSMFASKPEAITELRIGIATDVRSLDPASVLTSIELSVTGLSAEPLTRARVVDGKLEQIPWIAESWRRYNDTFWEITIRKGVKYHCGGEVTAQDIAWLLDKVANWKNMSTPKYNLGEVDRFVAIDDYTLLMGANKTVAAALSYLYDGGIYPAVPREFASQPGFGITNFCGTGPYKLLEKVKDERLVFVKNEDYWNKDYPPRFDKITVKIISDPIARLTALETGEVDYISQVPPSQIGTLRQKGFEVDIYPDQRSIEYWINTAKEPTDDIRVRQAINYAVDKKTIAKELYYDSVTPSDGIYQAGPFGRVQISKVAKEPMFPYDPEKAKQLLADAGYGPNNQPTITIWNSMNRYLLDKELGETIAGYLRKVGFNVNIKQMQFGSYQGIVVQNSLDVHAGKANPRDFEYNMGIYSLAVVTMDVDNGFVARWWSKASQSLTFWWIPGRFGQAIPSQLDDVGLEQSRTLDQAKRLSLDATMQQLIFDGCPYLFMHTESAITARVPQLKGVTVRTEVYFFYDAHFEQGANAPGALDSIFIAAVITLKDWTAILT